MTEAPLRDISLLTNRRETLRATIPLEFSGRISPKLMEDWGKLTITEHIISGVSLALAAHDRDELTVLVGEEFKIIKALPEEDARNKDALSKSNQPEDRKILLKYAKTEGKTFVNARGGGYYEPDRQEEGAVARSLGRRLLDLTSRADIPFEQMQRRAARLIAQLMLAVHGQKNLSHQNLKYRMNTVAHTTTGIMDAFLGDDSQATTSADFEDRTPERTERIVVELADRTNAANAAAQAAMERTEALLRGE